MRYTVLRKSIITKISVSYLLIIVISMTIAGVVFTYAVRQYLENNIKYDLQISARVISGMYKSDESANNTSADLNGGNSDNSGQLLLGGVFKKGLEEQDISYAVINDKMKIASSNIISETDFRKSILANISNKLKKQNSGSFKLSISGSRNIGIFESIGDSATAKWIILFTPMTQLDNLYNATLMILLV
jgi:hypothetical protein